MEQHDEAGKGEHRTEGRAASRFLLWREKV